MKELGTSEATRVFEFPQTREVPPPTSPPYRRVWFSSAGDILQSNVKEYTHVELNLGLHLVNRDPMGAMILKLTWLPQNDVEVEFLHFGHRKPLTGFFSPHFLPNPALILFS